MKKIMMTLLALMISFSSNADIEDNCFCSELGYPVGSPEWCEGECLKLQKVTRNDKGAVCDMYVLEIDGVSHYVGVHNCSCRGPEECGDIDSLLESMKKEYPAI